MKLKVPVSITGFASVSALGANEGHIWKAYRSPTHCLSKKTWGDEVWVAQLPQPERQTIDLLGQSDPKYGSLDPSVLYAIATARRAMEAAGWSQGDGFGINVGSSRGATTLFERYHGEFLEKGRTGTLASPTTTLGNIASWVAHDIGTQGPVISHSITCSTALHALLNGVAWLQSGLAHKFLVGGSEAPLTPFTLAQMRALKIYSKEIGDYPCRALDLGKEKNTMVLGEGAAMACLEAGDKKNAKAKILGIGYATEPLQHNVSISADAQCFQDSMKMALGDIAPTEIDGIVMHAPGTVKGDNSEFKAIQKVFGETAPFLTTNKWKLGHTFGASGMLSLEMALLMLEHQQAIPVPFIEYSRIPKELNMLLVNAVGFGGNAVSVLLSK